MPRKDSIPASSSTAQAQQEAISDGIENYELPKTLVTRIAKSSVRFLYLSVLQTKMLTVLS